MTQRVEIRTSSGSETCASRRPNREEITNCAKFLRRLVALIDPRVVVTPGAVSLAALRAIEYHALSLKENAGTIHVWNGRLLVPRS